MSSRRAFTLVEAMTALGFSLLVLTAAYGLLSFTGRSSRYSGDTSDVVGAAAFLMHALQRDLAAQVPVTDPRCLIDKDPVRRPGEKALVLRRVTATRAQLLEEPGRDALPEPEVVEVTYRLQVRDPSGWSITREESGEERELPAVRARDVTLRVVYDLDAERFPKPGRAFLKVALLLVPAAPVKGEPPRALVSMLRPIPLTGAGR